jgi:hypothetical protein
MATALSILAWIAAKLAAALTPDDVRLGANPPDCELRTAGIIQPFEIAEAHIQGRRRGEEYRVAAANPTKWRFDRGVD